MTLLENSPANGAAKTYTADAIQVPGRYAEALMSIAVRLKAAIAGAGGLGRALLRSAHGIAVAAKAHNSVGRLLSNGQAQADGVWRGHCLTSTRPIRLPRGLRAFHRLGRGVAARAR